MCPAGERQHIPVDIEWQRQDRGQDDVTDAWQNVQAESAEVVFDESLADFVVNAETDEVNGDPCAYHGFEGEGFEAEDGTGAHHQKQKRFEQFGIDWIIGTSACSV